MLGYIYYTIFSLSTLFILLWLKTSFIIVGKVLGHPCMGRRPFIHLNFNTIANKTSCLNRLQAQ